MGLDQYLGLWGRCLFWHGIGSAGYSTILQIGPEEKRTFFSCKISLLKYLSLSEFSKTKENLLKIICIFIGRTDAEAEAPVLSIWCEEPTHWKRPWCWERLRAGGKGDDRGWDNWMASPTQWTWVWANFMNWWRTRKPGVLCSWGHRESDMISACIATIRVFCLHLQSLIRIWIPGTCRPAYLSHRMIYWLEALKAYQQIIVLARSTNFRLKQLLIMKKIKNHLNEMFFHLFFVLVLLLKKTWNR